ncbi:MAG: hypothetical protein CMN80_03400 [Spongiibacter sp.]|nr:hypothetical protein [Spongiibacter sp.]
MVVNREVATMAAAETGVIEYNLSERGRKHTGIARAFNTRAIVDHINSPATQERVKSRDLVGFYGHWPRIKFGMQPREGNLDKGIPSIVEPAIVTTFLQASPDGTIRHKAEFLDTDSGMVARKMHKSRVGGFSSAIDTVKNQFFGFDYVIDPNFNGNRGYALDSASDLSEYDIDQAIVAEYNRGIMLLLDSATDRNEALAQSLEHAQAENEQLMSMMLNGKGRLGGSFQMPARSAVDNADRFESEINAFDSASLAATKPPKKESDTVVEDVRSEFPISRW